MSITGKDKLLEADLKLFAAWMETFCPLLYGDLILGPLFGEGVRVIFKKDCRA
jgi:CxxC motif-containing protein